VCVSAAFTGGKKDTVDKQATSVDSWLETVDIKDKKPGKYNILITAEDLAGNQAFAGPHNMYVDPDSDLPVTRITNPLEGMRVPGNLNVVGTCIDDDAVDHVELVFDNAETPVRANGKDFWSYYLDTNGLSEGPHSISVYGIDINGVKGKPYKVTWNLDRNRPETAVDNISMGSLVTGKFVLAGKVTDGNGIKRLSYSLNNGKNFEEIKLSYNKRDSAWTFNLSIDSKKMPDGPNVCWFKAEDGQGSIGIYTFLYFIDNTKPTVDFISPEPQKAVNGIFSVAGFARDTNGIVAVTWKMGKESGSFDLIKGNPYWIKEFDIRGTKEKMVQVDIAATDVAGNTTVVSRKIPVDAAADIPSLSVSTPEPGAVIDGNVFLSGFATDDDGIASVRYSLDKGAPVDIQTVGPFGIALAALATGRHSVEIWPVDINGVRGPSSILPFISMGPKPTIVVDPIVGPNAEIGPEVGMSLSATVSSEAGLKGLSYTITGMPGKTIPIKAGATVVPVKIPVTPDFPYGLLELEITAVDIHDRETHKKTDFYVTNLGIPRDTPPAFSDAALTSTADVTIAANGKTPASTGSATVTIERVLPDDVPFTNGMNVTLAGPGRAKELQKDAAVRIGIESPVPVTGFAWSLNGSAPVKANAQKTGDTHYEALVPLKYLLPADWTKIDATVTFKDLSTQSVSGVVCVIRPEPSAGMYDSEQFAWDQTEKNEKDAFLLFDGLTAVGLYNGKPDRFAASVAFEKPVDGLSVSLSGNVASVTGTKDGEYSNVVLVITDNVGEKFRTTAATFVVDSGAPAITLDTSERPLWLQNALPVKGVATDTRGVARVEYSFDQGKNWTSFRVSKFDEKLDISSLPDGLVSFTVRATDLVGRTSLEHRAFVKDTIAPEATVVVPEAGDVVNGETGVAFNIVDAGFVVSAEYRAPGDRTAKDKTEWRPLALSSMTNTIVGTADQPIDDKMEFRFTDAAGNSSTITSYSFAIDAKADRPVVEVHVPEENEVVRKDFVVSGVVYDDDQPAKVWYRIDKGPYTSVDIKNSYSIPIALHDLTDNEHTISLYAEDIHGVRGDEIVRTIRVSLEEPKAMVMTPSFETTNTGVIDITGTASDKNGIDKVEISLDNGNSFNLAVGAESWSYRFDTRVIQDGTHVVFVRVYDKYGTTGLYSSLINIDNMAPSIKLELPLDGCRSSGTLFVSGQTMDNIGLEKVSAKISNIDPKQPAIPSSLAEIPFEKELIISRGIDIKALPEGFYNLEVRGYDKAGNITRVSRNFEVYRGKDRNRIDFLYPLNGEKAQGVFNIYGKVTSEDPVSTLMLYIDDANAAATELSPTGYFKFTVSPDMIADGTHKLSVRALVTGDKIIMSEDHSVLYRADGPWITIDNLAMGEFAIERPWLNGTAGYSLTEEDLVALKAKTTTQEERRALQAKTLEKVEISLDNGKTFMPTESGKKWRYRIETGDIAEGYHFLIVRARMQNGEVAVSRTIIQVDKTIPNIKLISPGEGGRYNNDLVFSGLSSDDVQLKSVKLSLRPGDKSSYAVPTFIQGLYFDWHFWGATLYDVGLGLTFFDENVKLQGQYGQLTEEQYNIFKPGAGRRYGGNVFAIKMLANLASVPMDYFFGPDFSWLSAKAAIGANFSLFSETQSGKPQILSAMLAQLEFPRVTIPKRTMFRTFSLYTEFQLWFIPTDVDSNEVNINSLVPQLTGGIRVNVF
jgi:hypothetical protein